MKHLKTINELNRTIGFRYSKPTLKFKLKLHFSGDINISKVEEALKYLDITFSDISIVENDMYEVTIDDHQFEKLKEDLLELTIFSYKEEEIKEIKDLYNELKSTRKVSKELGISRDYIRKYVDIYIPDKLTDEELKKNNYNRVYKWVKEAKKMLVLYKGGKCINCGYSNCMEGLDFHHLDPKEKDFEISGKSYAMDRLLKEVDKCVLLCSNCHREVHAGYLTLKLE